MSLSKRFALTKAVDSVSLSIDSQTLTALLGESGCGKTTLLRLLAGLEKPDSGQINLNNQDITYLAPQKRGIGLVFQDFALFPHLTVEQNVGFGLKQSDKYKVASYLDRVKLSDLAKRYPHELSGGQQQRVALARALAVEPKVLLLDEPFSNLDPSLKQEMTWELKNWLKDLTVVMVTHDAKDALSVADKLVLMRKGSVVQAGTPSELYLNPVDAYTADFFGVANFFEAQELQRFFGEHRKNGLYMVRAEDWHVAPSSAGWQLWSKSYQGGRWLACFGLEEKKIFVYLPEEFDFNTYFYQLTYVKIRALTS